MHKRRKCARNMKQKEACDRFFQADDHWKRYTSASAAKTVCTVHIHSSHYTFLKPMAIDWIDLEIIIIYFHSNIHWLLVVVSIFNFATVRCTRFERNHHIDIFFLLLQFFYFICPVNAPLLHILFPSFACIFFVAPLLRLCMH